METIASILFGIGVAASVTCSVLLVCLIGSYGKEKRLVELNRQKKATNEFWSTYWATAGRHSYPLCTVARVAITKAYTEALAEQDKLNVTEEFSELEKHKIISGGDK